MTARLKTYRVYVAMKYRCENPKSVSYARYGGRGLTVCERWATFDVFLSDMGLQPPGLTLERIDNNKGYSRENCKWATRTENMRNTSRSRYLEFNGERRCISDWAEVTGLNKVTILQRINHGWTVENALTMPSMRQLAPLMRQAGLTT